MTALDNGDNAQAKKILIIKAGTLKTRAAHLVDRFGDQDDIFVSSAAYAKNTVEVVSVFEGERLTKQPDEYAGILITGSAAMLSTPQSWMNDTAAWLKTGVERNVPVLGVCFGHQMLAYALGGRIAPNPNGLEAGTVSVLFNGDRQGDPLFSDFPDEADFHVHHQETVAEAPEGALVLACNAHDRHQAVRFADKAWGVQFHPELDADIMNALIEVLAEGMTKAGIAVAPIRESIKDAPYGPVLLKRFYRLALEGPVE